MKKSFKKDLKSEDVEAVLDFSGTLDRLDGDVELVQELFNMFVREIPARIKDFRQAITDDDMGRMEKLIHSFKGVAGNLGATKVAEIALQIEKEMQKNNRERVVELLPSLEEAVFQVRKILEGYKDE